MKPSFVLSLFGVFFAYLLFPIQSQSMTVVAVPNADEQVDRCANIMAVTDSKVEKGIKFSNGMTVDKCTLYGEMLQGSFFPKGFYDEKKPVTFYMIDPTLVKGLTACQNGMKGVVGINNPGPIGITAFCLNGQVNYLEQKAGDQVLMPKAISISNPQLRNKLLQANPQFSKTLRLGPAGAAPQDTVGVEGSREQTVEIFRALIQNKSQGSNGSGNQ